MNCVFHPDAKAEFLAAIEYYEECEPGLGADFAIEVRSTIEHILSFQMLGLHLMTTCGAVRPAGFLMASSIHTMKV